MDTTPRRALVCGASQGIGQAIAIHLANMGFSLTLVARNSQNLETVLGELPYKNGQEHRMLCLDLSDTQHLNESLAQEVAAKRFQDVVVHNAGGPAPGPAHQSTLEQYSQAFALHVLSAQSLVQHYVPQMKQQKFGRLIQIISTSVKQPIPGLGVSNTIRGAMASWSKSLATELGPFGITVNNVLPGATQTARLDGILENKANKLAMSVEAVAEQEKKAIPARRFASPQETAAAVGFLLSEEASYINGVNLPVDGGRTQCL